MLLRTYCRFSTNEIFSVSWQFSEPYGVTNHGILEEGCRKPVFGVWEGGGREREGWGRGLVDWGVGVGGEGGGGKGGLPSTPRKTRTTPPPLTTTPRCFSSTAQFLPQVWAEEGEEEEEEGGKKKIEVWTDSPADAAAGRCLRGYSCYVRHFGLDRRLARHKTAMSAWPQWLR